MKRRTIILIILAGFFLSCVGQNATYRRVKLDTLQGRRGDTVSCIDNLRIDKRLNVDSVITLADTTVVKRFGNKSYGFGVNNSLLRNYSLVAGYQNNTINNFGYVFGHNNIKITDAVVSGGENDSITSSFVLGGNNANILNSTICGYNNQEVSGSYLIGLNNLGLTDSYVIGNTNNTINLSGLIGNYNNNITTNSYVFGENNTVTEYFSYSIGQTNNNITTNSYNIGFTNDSISDNSFSIGERLDTITNYSYVFGIGNKRINNFSFVIGSTNKDITKDCNVFGQFNRYIDTTSTVLGALNTNIKKSYVFGNYCDTIYNKSFAIGTGLYNIRDTLFAFGKYNVDVSDSTEKRAFVFAYGGGDAARKNYAEILKNGKLYLNYGGIHTQGVSRMRTDTLFIDSVNTTLTAAFTQWIYIKTGADNDTIDFPSATKDLAGVEITITKDNTGIGDVVINYGGDEVILTAIDDYAVIRCNGYRWILYGNKLTP